MTGSVRPQEWPQELIDACQGCVPLDYVTLREAVVRGVLHEALAFRDADGNPVIVRADV